jgi:hypothetical protein
MQRLWAPPTPESSEVILKREMEGSCGSWCWGCDCEEVVRRLGPRRNGRMGKTIYGATVPWRGTVQQMQPSSGKGAASRQVPKEAIRRSTVAGAAPGKEAMMALSLRRFSSVGNPIAPDISTILTNSNAVSQRSKTLPQATEWSPVLQEVSVSSSDNLTVLSSWRLALCWLSRHKSHRQRNRLTARPEPKAC